MKVLLLTTAYPSEGDYYNHGFIHSRIKEYISINSNHTIEIGVVNHDKNISEYEYEGVKVIKGNSEILTHSLDIDKFDRVLVHFLDHKIIKLLDKVKYKDELLVWVHGAEALSWKRRTFNKFNISFLKYILSNHKQLRMLNKFVKENNNKLTFIFVSKWMKDIMEHDCKVKVEKFKIIPNVIDTEFFDYNDKPENMRKKILSIRPYTSRKYATDVMVDTIIKLSKEFNDFDKLEFTLVGKGELFSTDTKCLENFSNVKLINKFLHYNDIKKLHNENGVLLIPTRQDSQGVSMCEGMSSGLVPLTSNNTAIPEFVDINCGYLANSSEELKNAIIELYNNPEKFKMMSKSSSLKMINMCSKENTIYKEYELIFKEAVL
ncbi:glycosyltransferase family 4 protein [Macrococcus capreoli]